MDPVPSTSQPPFTLVVKEAPVPDADLAQKSVSFLSVPSDGDPNLGHGQLAPDLMVNIALVSYAVPDSEESVSIRHVLSESFLALSTSQPPPASPAEARLEPDAVPDSDESISYLVPNVVPDSMESDNSTTCLMFIPATRPMIHLQHLADDHLQHQADDHLQH